MFPFLAINNREKKLEEAISFSGCIQDGEKEAKTAERDFRAGILNQIFRFNNLVNFMANYTSGMKLFNLLFNSAISICGD